VEWCETLTRLCVGYGDSSSSTSGGGGSTGSVEGAVVWDPHGGCVLVVAQLGPDITSAAGSVWLLL